MARKTRHEVKTRDREGLWDKVQKTATPLAERDRFHSRFVEFLNDQDVRQEQGNQGRTHREKSEKTVPASASGKKPTDTALPWPKGTVLKPIGKPVPFPRAAVTDVSGSQSSSPSAAQHPSQSLDEATARKIRKGRISIDAILDLHGMTQIEAHQRLFRFLESAQKMDNRVILVITGKGNAGEGILRRAVPQWLAEAPFRHLVSGHRGAHQTHGGSGALYVRVRRGMRKG